jgi:hypothetical protein
MANHTRRSLFGAMGVAVAMASAGLASDPLKRQAAVPSDVIHKYDLRPAVRGELSVLGEDGKYYALDDVIGALFTITRRHWEQR